MKNSNPGGEQAYGWVFVDGTRKFKAPQATYYGSAPPTVGAFKKGDIVMNTEPAASQPIGWVCVDDQGTFKPFGMISS